MAQIETEHTSSFSRRILLAGGTAAAANLINSGKSEAQALATGSPPASTVV